MKLEYYIGCRKCHLECEPTEEGIICPQCGDYISDKELDG